MTRSQDIFYYAFKWNNLTGKSHLFRRWNVTFINSLVSVLKYIHIRTYVNFFGYNKRTTKIRTVYWREENGKTITLRRSTAEYVCKKRREPVPYKREEIEAVGPKCGLRRLVIILAIWHYYWMQTLYLVEPENSSSSAWKTLDKIALRYSIR